MTNGHILITGGTGFVGSHLVEKLISLVDRNQIHITSFKDKNSHSFLKSENVHSVDLTDKNQVFQLFSLEHFTHIYHLAAFADVGSSFEQTEKVLENNLKLQYNTLEAHRQLQPQAKLLMIGSAMEYDLISNPPDSPINESHPLGPVSPYAVSKVFQDLLSLSYYYSYQANIIRVRPFNHTGERQTENFVIPSFAKQIVEVERGQKSEIRVGNLEAIRDFSDVKDIVEAYVLLMDKGQIGEVYNLGSGKGIKIEQVLKMMINLSGLDIPIIADESRLRQKDVPAVIADISKIQNLGFSPTHPLDETLQRVLNYWRNQ